MKPRTSLRTAATLLGLGLLVACQGNDTRASSATNWLACTDDSDCAGIEGGSCDSEGWCVDAEGVRVTSDEAASQTGASGDGSSTSDGGDRTASSGGDRAASGGASGEAAAGGTDSEPSVGGASTSAGGNDSEPSTGGAPASAGASETGTGGEQTAAGGSSGGSEPTGAGAGGDATETAASGAGGTGGAAGSNSVASCEDDWAPPELDRSCSTVTDCFLAGHIHTCCGGSRMMLGFNVEEREAFDAYEALCPPQTCECRLAVVLEDGTELLKGDASLVCDAGQCKAICPPTGCVLSDDCSNDDECLSGT